MMTIQSKVNASSDDDDYSDDGCTEQYSTSIIHNLRIVSLVTCLLTFIVGLIGNGLVLFVIAKNKNIRKNSVANYYIGNLALADLLFILTLPFFIYSTGYEHWPFGGFMCKLATALYETNRFSSIFTLVALSFDRLLATFVDLGHWRKVSQGKAVIAAIWIMCALISSPYWIYAQTHVSPYNDLAECSFALVNVELIGRYWPYFQLVVGLLIPLTVIVTSYVLCAHRLRSLLRHGHASSVKRPNKALTRTVFLVLTTFIVCNTPDYLVKIWDSVSNERLERGDSGCLSQLEVSDELPERLWRSVTASGRGTAEAVWVLN